MKKILLFLCIFFAGCNRPEPRIESMSIQEIKMELASEEATLIELKEGLKFAQTHYENCCRVLERFGNVSWDNNSEAKMVRDATNNIATYRNLIINIEQKIARLKVRLNEDT